MKIKSGVLQREIFSPKDGVPNFSFRIFHVEAGGCTPRHAHDWEHEVFIVSGKGKLIYGEDKKEHIFSDGYVVFVEPGSKHQFRNTEDSPLKFLCLVPNRGQNQFYE